MLAAACQYNSSNGLLLSRRKFDNKMATLRTFGFGIKAFKKFPELIPLVAIISSACTMGISFIGYALATKPDVRIIKSKGPAFEDVTPLESRKLMDRNKEKYQSFPDVEALRKELGSYKS